MTTYARYVNGRVTGLESGRQAAAMARMSWVSGDLATGLHWRDRDPSVRGGMREWQLVPITEEQAENFRTHGVLNYERDRPCADA